MKHLIGILSLTIFSLQIYAHVNEILLNGIWKFKAPIDLEWGIYKTIKSELSDIHWDSIAVPGNWDVENNYAEYLGEAAYYRTFTIPDSFRHGELFLHFDAVYYESMVYINGNYLGMHTGGYTPFEFCITDMVKKDSINELLVLVNNEFSRGAWWSWGGISRNVAIHQYNETKISNFHISAIPDFSNGLTTFSISAEVENLIARKQEMEINLSFSDHAIPAQKKNFVLDKNGFYTYRTIFIIPTQSIKLWHYDNPNLYYATINVGPTANEVHHTQKTRFGVRKVEVKGTQFLLNNEPVRAFGFNRVSDHRAYGNTEPFDLIKKDIDHMKSMGSILTRIMHTPQSPELLDYCDSIGMLLIAENPVWSKFDPHAYANSPVAKQWYEQLINRDYNHPSIIAWSVANEIGIDEHWSAMRMSKEQFRYVSSMFHHIKTSLDSTRLLTYASFTAFRAKANAETDPAGLGDFISFNSYGDILDNCIQIHNKWPDKPIFITEFGRGMIGENPNTSVIQPVVFDLLRKANQLPYLMGASLWTYNDYRSRYRGTPASQNRAWGIVDVWRNPKIATREIQQLFSPVKNFGIELKGRKLIVSLSENTPEEIPNTSLKNYFLVLRSEKGKTARIPLDRFSTHNHIYHITLNLADFRLSGNFLEVGVQTPTKSEIATKRISLVNLQPPTLIHSRADRETMQVSFFPVSGASGYVLHYNGNKIPLIRPDFEIVIDKKATTHQIMLEAHDDNGRQSFSNTIKLNIQNTPLPPVIQHIEKVYNGYVVGFTVAKEDQGIEVKYTSGAVEKRVSSELKGSFKITEDKPIKQLWIRRKVSGILSDWSYPYTIN